MTRIKIFSYKEIPAMVGIRRKLHLALIMVIGKRIKEMMAGTVESSKIIGTQMVIGVLVLLRLRNIEMILIKLIILLLRLRKRKA